MNEETEYEFNSKLILESLACGDPYLRRNFIGASDAPIIMGVSPWRTPYQLWQEKCGLISPQQETYSMARGTAMEDEARLKFESITGIKVLPKRLFHPEYEWMMASLDGIDELGDTIVEIKCPGETSHKICLDGKIPSIYYPQLQHQMIVAGAEQMYYFSYTKGSCKSLICHRDEEYCKTLIEKEIEFWDCIQNMREPEMTYQDYHKKSDIEWAILSNEWKSVQASKKKILEREEQIKSELILSCDNRPSMGEGIKVKKITKKGAIDYENIFELSSIDLEKYRKKSTEYWKIYLTDEDEG